MRTQDMPVVDLRGGPRERGQIYGESQRERIGGILEHWYRAIEADHKVAPESYIADFLAETDFLPAIEKHTPDVMEEVRGMAEGADVSQDVMLAFNCMDEEWWFGRERLARSGAKGDDGEHCSALGIAGQQGLPTFVAQTMDIAGWSEGYQVLLRHHDDQTGLTSLMFSAAGMLMLTGMNDAGVAVCCNTLLQLERRRDGLPVQFVTRGILAQKSFEDAVAFVRAVPHASGQNYTIGAAGRVVSLECSANQVSAYVPGGDANRVWHTNHPFANDDITRGAGSPLDEGGAMASANTLARYDCLTRRIGEGRVTAETIKAALASRDDAEHPVSRTVAPGQSNVIGFTAGAMVYVLENPPHMELAAGPPCSTEFLPFGFAAAAAAAAE
jgi:isopenicillin-N N-acyltransferase like protein